MKKIKFYTKEETAKIVELFMSKASRKECEEYAKSIGRTYNEIKQKAYYEFNYSKKDKKSKSMKSWNEGELNFLVQNWRNLSRSNREKYAKSIGRTFQACEKMYYKSRPQTKKQKPGEITVTHVTKAVQPDQKTAVITIGDVQVALPNFTKSIEINGNKLIW